MRSFFFFLFVFFFDFSNRRIYRIDHEHGRRPLIYSVFLNFSFSTSFYPQLCSFVFSISFPFSQCSRLFSPYRLISGRRRTMNLPVKYSSWTTSRTIRARSLRRLVSCNQHCWKLTKFCVPPANQRKQTKSKNRFIYSFKLDE